jgi:hypothetical protein
VLKAFAAALKKIRDDVKDTVYSGLVRSIESAFRSKQKESIDAKSSEYPALACLISNWKLVSDSLSGGDLQKLHPAEHLEKLPLFFLRFFPNAEQGQEMSGLHRAKFSKVNAALAHDLNDSPTRVLGEYVDQLKKAGFANKVFILNPYRSSTEKDLFLVEDGDCLGVKSPEMKKYLSAYERIKNAFFVPATDQPWVRPDEGLEATNFADSGQSNERTVVMGSGLSSTRSHVRDVHFGHQEPNEMNAVVPIRSDATSSCVMLLQGIDLQGDTFELREIYEVLGSIVCGILVDDMGDAFSRGAMKLEDCDWLDLWSEGTLRKQREASFYLGLNLSANQYALCYCSVEAGKEIEKFIASSVWHEMHRAKYKNSQSPQSEIRFREVSSAIDATIRNTSNGVQLKNFSCVLSVFDRRSSQVYSVQWGNTRPLVLGSQNYIKTREKSSIGLGAGKIPLFEMNASLVKDGAYILALKLLDNIPKAVRLSMMSERKPLTIGSPEGAQGSVEQLIQEFWNTSGYQPRYFVVVSHKKAKKKSLVAKVDEPA